MGSGWAGLGVMQGAHTAFTGGRAVQWADDLAATGEDVAAVFLCQVKPFNLIAVKPKCGPSRSRASEVLSNRKTASRLSASYLVNRGGVFPVT